MVRMIFTPKGTEDNWVKAVQGHEIARILMLPSSPAPVYRVALCEDGKKGSERGGYWIRWYLEKLFRRWGVTTTVVVENFTFYGNTNDAYEKLVRCDMFYFAGVLRECDLSNLQSSLMTSSCTSLSKF